MNDNSIQLIRTSQLLFSWQTNQLFLFYLTYFLDFQDLSKARLTFLTPQTYRISPCFFDSSVME